MSLSPHSAAVERHGPSRKRTPVLALLREHWGPILVTGVLFCAPSGCFWAFLSDDKGGDAGGAVALVLGLISFLLGLPWNIPLAMAWDALAKALDHPAWLGDTRNEWFGLAMILVMSVAGAFINGVIVGWIVARVRSRG